VSLSSDAGSDLPSSYLFPVARPVWTRQPSPQMVTPASAPADRSGRRALRHSHTCARNPIALFCARGRRSRAWTASLGRARTGSWSTAARLIPWDWSPRR